MIGFGKKDDTDDLAMFRAKFDYISKKAEIELDNIRWRNRRRMAWLSLISVLVATVIFPFLPADKITVLEGVIGWFYMTMASVVAAYVGTAAYTYAASLRNPADGFAQDDLGSAGFGPVNQYFPDNTQQYHQPGEEGVINGNYGGGRLEGVSMDSSYYGTRE